MSHRWISYSIFTLLVAASAEAHPADVSQSEWTIDGNVVRGRVEVAVRDLGGQALRELLERKTQVDLGGPCKTAIIEIDEPKGEDGEAVQARFDCPSAGGMFGLKLAWLEGMSPEHKHVAHVTYGSAALTAVLTRDNALTTLAAPPTPQPPPAPARWPWIAVGIAFLVLVALRLRARTQRG